MSIKGSNLYTTVAKKATPSKREVDHAYIHGAKTKLDDFALGLFEYLLPLAPEAEFRIQLKNLYAKGMSIFASERKENTGQIVKKRGNTSGILKELCKNGELYVLNRVADHLHKLEIQEIFQTEIRSFLFSPLVVNKKCIGAIIVGNQQELFFTWDTQSQFLKIAHWATFLLEKTLYNDFKVDMLIKEKKQLEREVLLAREIHEVNIKLRESHAKVSAMLDGLTATISNSKFNWLPGYNSTDSRVAIFITKQLAAAFNDFPVMVWMKDVSHNFRFANKRFLTFWNVKDLTDLTEKNTATILPLRLNKIHGGHEQKILEEGIGVSSCEKFQTLDQAIWFDVIKSPVVDSEGKIIGLLAIAVERKKI